MDIETELETFIVTEILLKDSQNTLDPGQSLINLGVLDSIALLRLVGFIEEKFEVTIEDQEVKHENFETIIAMKTLIANKIKSNR